MKLKTLTLAIALALSAGANAQVFGNQETVATTSYLKAVGAPQAWARGFTGKGIIIGVVDNGFDLKQTDIKKNVLAFANFSSTAVVVGVHGTQMASIAAGVADGNGTVGVAPDAKLVLAQANSTVSSSTGLAGTGISMASVLKGMAWAEAQGASIINLSLGSTYDSTFQSKTVMIAPGIYNAPDSYTNKIGGLDYLYGSSLKDVAAFAGTTKNAVIVAASGNSATPFAQFPGAYATQTDANGNLLLGGRVIIVGNVKGDGKGGWIMSETSSAAGSLCSNIVASVCQDKYYVKDFYVVAPGTGILGAIPDSARTAASITAGKTNGVGGVSGSSPAAAVVSGGIALMKQAWPQLRANQLVSLVLNTATPLGDSNVYGKGMVNFDKATQPMGQLTLANLTKLTGSGITGTAVVGTGIVTSGSSSLGTSSVLQNTQVVDTIGRNYTVDMTKAVGYNNALSYQYGTPWMAFGGSNYRQVVTPVGRDGLLSIMASDSGSSSQYEWQQTDDTRLSIEVGALSERNGFLGTHGGGAMSFGGSNTAWTGLGFSKNIVGSTNLIGSYTVGLTRTGNVQGSMVQLDSSVIADSWKLGVAQSNLAFSGKTKDTLSLTVASPVAVRKGSATVMGVTGYTYTDNADGTTDANPVMQTERVSLAPKAREMNLVLGYTVTQNNTSSIGVNVVRQFNAGGQAGVQGTGVSIMARSVF